jgi:hypothetical protein
MDTGQVMPPVARCNGVARNAAGPPSASSASTVLIHSTMAVCVLPPLSINDGIGLLTGSAELLTSSDGELAQWRSPTWEGNNRAQPTADCRAQGARRGDNHDYRDSQNLHAIRSGVAGVAEVRTATRDTTAFC